MNRDRETLDRIVARKRRATANVEAARAAHAATPNYERAELLRIARLELEWAEGDHRRALEMINRR